MHESIARGCGRFESTVAFSPSARVCVVVVTAVNCALIYIHFIFFLKNKIIK